MSETGYSIENDPEIVMHRGERCIQTAPGNYVPVEKIRPLYMVQHQTAISLVGKMRDLAEENKRRKAAIYADIQSYLDLVMEHYNARLGGRRGGVTIVSFGDCHKVAVNVADYMRVTSALPAAQALVNEILDDLTGDANSDLRALIASAFERDEKTGRVNVQRLLALRRLSLSHPRWPDAVNAISDAVEMSGSKAAIRAYYRETPQDAWEQVVVDFSRLAV